MKMPSEINFPYSDTGVVAWHRSDKITWFRDWTIQGKRDILFFRIEITGKDFSKGIRGEESLVYVGKTGFVYYDFTVEEKLSGFFDEDDMRGAIYYEDNIPVDYKMEYKGRMYRIKQKQYHPESFRTDLILSPIMEN
jgi:hypothetical protein